MGKVVAGGIEDAVLLEVPALVEATQEKTQGSKSLLSGPGQTASIPRLLHVERKCHCLMLMLCQHHWIDALPGPVLEVGTASAATEGFLEHTA